jgi:hypothetical protein
MKMVVISLMILVVLIGVWAWFHFTYIDPVTSYFWENLLILSDKVSLSDWESAEFDMEAYAIKWQDIREYWVYFINQEDIDNIDFSIKKSEMYIKNRNKSNAQAELEHLRLLFNVIEENECLSLDNIF